MMRVPMRRLLAVPKARPAGACAMALLMAAAAAPAQALTIVPTFDSSVTSLANASAVQAAFKAVAHDYAISFDNPARVNVNVSWGSVAGSALPATAVGASVSNLYGYFSFAQIRGDLTNFSAANPRDTSLATAVKSLPTAAPAGPSRYVVPSAQAKALGLISPTQASVDGSIGFAGAASGYDFDPSNGVAAGTYDFRAVAAHELAEVLGRISGISSATPAWRTPFDLFRARARGILGYSYSEAAYFSIDGGVTRLKDFNNSTAGGDRGDWLTSSAVLDVSNAFIQTGRAYNLTAVDLTSLDVLGWGGSNLGNSGVATPGATAFALISQPGGVPEPAQWALLLVGFGLTGAALRRRRLPSAQAIRVR